MSHTEPDNGSSNEQHVPDEISLGPTLEGQIEKTLIRKIDLHILPIVVLLYLFSFLDRGTCPALEVGVSDSSLCDCNWNQKRWLT
jgi:hypothetical protein